jgi:cysteine-rich repeat protein
VHNICVAPECGNGDIDDGEACDDENSVSGDGCRGDCSKEEACGDSEVDVGEPCDDGNLEDGDGCDCRSPDLPINTTTREKQESPSIGVAPSGIALIAWEDGSRASTDVFDHAIRARLMGDRPIGLDQVVNTQIALDQIAPRVAASVNGTGYLVVWTDLGSAEPDTSPSSIRGRLLDPTGGTLQADFVINTTTEAVQELPAVAALPAGGYVVVWRDDSRAGADQSVSAIRLQRLSDSGELVGAEVEVNTTRPLAQSNPAVAAAADGTVLVVWDDTSQAAPDSSGLAIRGRRLDQDGTFLDPMNFIVNTTTSGNQVRPDVAALAGGDFIVVWHDGSLAPTDVGEIRARRIPATGDPTTSDFVVNTTSQELQEVPAVAALPGGVLVVWEDNSGQAPDLVPTAVRGRWLAPDGSPLERNDFVLNRITFEDQGDPDVAAIDETTLLLAWEDESTLQPDTDSDAIRARVLSVLEE